jgi:phosphoribosylaminoimidazole-succinocarboxamide synthase
MKYSHTAPRGGSKQSYTGSVKLVSTIVPPTLSMRGRGIFTFTDHYSIFDWGHMPDELDNKGKALAVLAAYVFEAAEEPGIWKALKNADCWNLIEDPELRDGLRESDMLNALAEQGMRTHYHGCIDTDSKSKRLDDLKAPTDSIFVELAKRYKPSKCELDGKTVYDYHTFHDWKKKNYLVPLEFVFRFGVPKGSSLMDRLEIPGYVQSLGLKEAPKEGDWLPRPVLEYFTKLEPKDRHLGLSEAFNCSGLKPEQFSSVIGRNYLLAMFLYDMFSRAGLELWDGKVEHAKAEYPSFSMKTKPRNKKADPVGIKLVDAIGPDELRILKNGIQVSKEPVRQYHKKNQPGWFADVKRAKAHADQVSGVDWKQHCIEVLHSEPEPMDPKFKDVIEHMYTALTNEVTERSWFPDSMRLDEVTSSLKEYGLD